MAHDNRESAIKSDKTGLHIPILQRRGSQAMAGMRSVVPQPDRGLSIPSMPEFLLPFLCSRCLRAARK